jgi:hypothetical protein
MHACLHVEYGSGLRDFEGRYHNGGYRMAKG